ncbi:Trehalose-6-P synthase/phosphatase complex subunit [Sorochytrium milnesiophthora]
MKVIVARDKLGYIKGVKQKLMAYELFLQTFPEWVGKVVMVQVALSTGGDPWKSATEVSDIASRINSRFGRLEYTPLVYLRQDISYHHYLALLSIADACLITPLRDGMNLTSHEYIVCQKRKTSPLIMSEFAGTYGCFGSALRVNPWDYREVAAAINQALSMTSDEKLERWVDLYRTVTTYTACLRVPTATKFDASIMLCNLRRNLETGFVSNQRQGIKAPDHFRYVQVEVNFEIAQELDASHGRG